MFSQQWGSLERGSVAVCAYLDERVSEADLDAFCNVVADC